MKTITSSCPSLFSSIRVHLLSGTDKAKAMASCLVSNAIMITGIRIVEGKNGLFVSMPQKKNSKTGDYSDVAFPVSKEMREELSRSILEEFERTANSLDPQAHASA
jgi:stage V sporulation protein G